MTLRCLLALSLLIILAPMLLAADEWRKKPPADWTEDDARQVLTDSPWAQRVKVRYVESAGRSGGGSTRIPGGIPIPGGNPPGGGGSPVPGGGGRGVRTASEVTVRWQSSAAVRNAFAKLGVDTPPGLERAEDSYVIAAMAVPEMGQDIGDVDDPTTLNRLRDGARLLVGNKRSVIPDRVRASRTDEGLAVLFIFPKEKIGPLAGEKVKLIARIGPANLSAEFRTKDMKLDGTPDF